jgi:polyphosphate kinase 2 (PPK2 family)
MNMTKLLKRLRIDDPESFRLASFDPVDTGGMDLDKNESKALLAADIKRLAQLQRRLFADGHWAVLIVLQGMDTSGKDGVIAHVMTGLNPQGCEVHPFKAPSEEDLAHDFLGGPPCGCRGEDESVSSTDLITKRSSWCESTPNS